MKNGLNSQALFAGDNIGFGMFDFVANTTNDITLSATTLFGPSRGLVLSIAYAATGIWTVTLKPGATAWRFYAQAQCDDSANIGRTATVSDITNEASTTGTAITFKIRLQNGTTPVAPGTQRINVQFQFVIGKIRT